jgi:flagellar hook-associated protein 2
LEEAAEANTKKAADSNIVKELASKQKDSSEYTQALNDLLDRVNTAYTLQNKALFNSQVKKVAGQDSEIELNGVKYTGDSNSYSINGLTIEALAETGDSAISITTSTDTQGVYDKVKDFLTEYNNIINEMTKLYNADSAGSYEPLTDDEKDQMSDKEIEKTGQNAVIVGATTDSNDRVLISGEERRFLETAQTDEIYKVFN